MKNSTIEDVYLKFLEYKNLLEGKNFNILQYRNLQLKDEKIKEILTPLLDIDYNKFFISNFIFRKFFYFNMIKSTQSKSLYISLDSWLINNNRNYFKEILIESKNIKEINTNDRDIFILKLIKTTNLKFLGLIYPEIKELVLSLDDDKIKRTIIKFHLILSNMNGYKKLREKIFTELKIFSK